MNELTPAAWTESEDFRDVVKPEHHDDFLKTIADAHAEGYAITRVLVVRGVPIVYERRETTGDDEA